MADVAGRFAWHAAAVGLALGLADVVVTRRAWLGRLRMTKDEVKREHKDAEGDPRVRAARHRAYQELLAQAAIANVRTASVVVVNPTHLACALRYDEKGGDEAPVVVASGEGELAARIAQAAREWGIPIVRDVPLARALVELSVGRRDPRGALRSGRRNSPRALANRPTTEPASARWRATEPQRRERAQEREGGEEPDDMSRRTSRELLLSLLLSYPPCLSLLREGEDRAPRVRRRRRPRAGARGSGCGRRFSADDVQVVFDADAAERRERIDDVPVDARSARGCRGAARADRR